MVFRIFLIKERYPALYQPMERKAPTPHKTVQKPGEFSSSTRAGVGFCSGGGTGAGGVLFSSPLGGSGAGLPSGRAPEGVKWTSAWVCP